MPEFPAPILPIIIAVLVASAILVSKRKIAHTNVTSEVVTFSLYVASPGL